MKIKVNLEWLESHVFNHHPDVKKVIVEHGCVGIYQYDVKNYGVRVGFFDNRLKGKKFFVTPTDGNYQIMENVCEQEV